MFYRLLQNYPCFYSTTSFRQYGEIVIEHWGIFYHLKDIGIGLHIIVIKFCYNIIQVSFTYWRILSVLLRNVSGNNSSVLQIYDIGTDLLSTVANNIL